MKRRHVYNIGDAVLALENTESGRMGVLRHFGIVVSSDPVRGIVVVKTADGATHPCSPSSVEVLADQDISHLPADLRGWLTEHINRAQTLPYCQQ